MTLMRRPSPFGDLLALRTAMDRFLDEPLFRPVLATSDEAFAMPLDLRTVDDALVIEAALPGVRPEDVEISVLGDTLTLMASSRTDERTETAGVHLREIRRGRFRRTVGLPGGLRTDAARATFEDGILRLSIPRAEQARPHRIPVAIPADGPAAEPGTDAGSAAGTAG